MGAEGTDKAMPGIFVSHAEGVRNGIVQRRRGSAHRHHRKTAQHPKETEKNTVTDLGKGDHQGIVGIENSLKHDLFSSNFSFLHFFTES